MSAINARCGASLQSIAEGDACRVMLITQSSSFNPIELDIDGKAQAVWGIANSPVLLNCQWRPQTAFLRAVYDDYGMSRLVLQTRLDRMQVTEVFAALYRAGIRTLAGQNPYHDLAFDFAEFVRTNAPGLAAVFAPLQWFQQAPPANGGERDAELQACWTLVCDLVRRHRVFQRGYCNQVRPLQMFVVHERAYQALAADMDARVDWDGNSLELRALLERAVAQAREAADAERQAANSEGRDDSLSGVVFGETLRALAERLDSGISAFTSVGRRALDAGANKLYKGEMSDGAFIDTAFELMRDLSVLAAMGRLHMRLMPMTYVGADFDNAAGLAYSQFVDKVSREVADERRRVNA